MYQYCWRTRLVRPLHPVPLLVFDAKCRLMTQTHPDIKPYLPSYIQDIRIALRSLFSRYNGFFTNFRRFFKKIQYRFSQKIFIRFPKTKLLRYATSRGYRRLLVLHKTEVVHFLRAPPTYRVTVIEEHHSPPRVCAYQILQSGRLCRPLKYDVDRPRIPC